MASIGTTVGSKRMAMVEALVLNHRSGLTVPQAVRASRVPRTSAYRILHDLRSRGLVNVVAKAGKAEVFKLNPSRPEVVGLAKCVNTFTQYVAEASARAHSAEAVKATERRASRQVDFNSDVGAGYAVTVRHAAVASA